MLAKTFFPDLPALPILPDSVYPKPLEAKGIFSKNDILMAIKKLKPNKAPGLNGICNIVIQECSTTIVDNLDFIYKAILKFNIYPSCWLTSLTIVLHKPSVTGRSE